MNSVEKTMNENKRCKYCAQNKPEEQFTESDFCDDCKNFTTEDLVKKRGYIKDGEFWVKPSAGQRVTIKRVDKLGSDSPLWSDDFILEEFEDGAWKRIPHEK